MLNRRKMEKRDNSALARVGRNSSRTRYFFFFLTRGTGGVEATN